MALEVLGIYTVDEATEPCFLIECVVFDFDGNLDLTDVTQAVESLPEENWQVPWDEYLLAEDGLSGDRGPLSGQSSVSGKQRLAFFFHYLNPSQQLLTPFGKTSLPLPSERPRRLEFMNYESPD